MTKAEFTEFMDWAKEQTANINTLDNFSTATDVIKALREAEYRGYMKAVADRPQEWIPCKERLPKEAEPILVTINGKTYFAPFGINEESSKELGTVAWMPLPEPWKGADDDTD